jgi:DNA polymerase-3 subunit epsilon
MLAKRKRSVVLDLETTGFSPFRGDRVIEVGAIANFSGEIVAEFQSLIRAPRAIPWQSSQVHGITDAMLADQPLPDEVYPAFCDFIGRSSLVAHNARFDLTFLRYELGRLGLALNNGHFCTLELARRHLPQSPSEDRGPPPTRAASRANLPASRVGRRAPYCTDVAGNDKWFVEAAS